MGLFRFRKASADTESSRSSSSWTSRFRAISFSRNNNSINTTPPLECIPVAIGHVNSSLQRANTTSTISQMSSQQPSIAGSRPPSEMFCASPTDTTFTPSFPTRTPSMYSHRSYSIRRDSIRGRPPVLPRPSQTEISHHIPLATSEDGLVLTGTSRYPTGVAAELYIPEDCTYTTVIQREKEVRRHELKDQLRRNTDLIRRKSMIASPEEKKRLKRISVNF